MMLYTNRFLNRDNWLGWCLVSGSIAAASLIILTFVYGAAWAVGENAILVDVAWVIFLFVVYMGKPKTGLPSGEEWPTEEEP